MPAYDLYGYRYAAALADTLSDMLADTRAGVPPVIVHPGASVPMYGCDLGSVRVASITPAVPDRTTASGRARLPDTYVLALEMIVDRCYRVAPAQPAVPPIGWLDSAARDALEDARAMRRAALNAWPGQRVTREVGVWLPRAYEGGVHGGAMTVTLTGVTLECDPGQDGLGIDDTTPPVSGDHRHPG